MIAQHTHLIQRVYAMGGFIAFLHPEDDRRDGVACSPPNTEWFKGLIKPLTPEVALVEVRAVDGGQDFHIYMPMPDGQGSGYEATVQLMIGYVGPDEEVCDWYPAGSRFMEDWWQAYERETGA